MKKDWSALIREVPDEILKDEWARRFVKGRPPKVKACPHCGQQFNATELKAHVPRCPARLASDPKEVAKAQALLAYMQQNQPAKKAASALKRARKAAAEPRKRVSRQKPAGEKE